MWCATLYSYTAVLLAFLVPGFWWLAAFVANVCKVERDHGFPILVYSLFQLGLLPCVHLEQRKPPHTITIIFLLIKLLKKQCGFVY